MMAFAEMDNAIRASKVKNGSFEIRLLVDSKKILIAEIRKTLPNIRRS